MYKKNEMEIKREAITGEEICSHEIEVTVKTRGKLTSNQIKNITEIMDETLEKVVGIAISGEPDQGCNSTESAGK